MRIPFFFDPVSYAFVLDHCPENDPVIPFVSAIEAFYTTLHAHVGPCVLNDIRLVKGIIVPSFNGYEAEVVVDEAAGTVMLVGHDETLHYKATFVIPSKERIHLDPPSTSLRAWSGTTVPGDYNFLFHGPMLHSIESITADNPEQGAQGVLKTAPGMKWVKTDWFFDPFVCDGALQMGCQLAYMVKHKASLPSKIKRAIFYNKPTNTSAVAHLTFQKLSALQYIFDVHIYDNHNTPICTLEGIESYFRLSKGI